MKLGEVRTLGAGISKVAERLKRLRKGLGWEENGMGGAAHIPGITCFLAKFYNQRVSGQRRVKDASIYQAALGVGGRASRAHTYTALPSRVHTPGLGPQPLAAAV